MSCFDFSRIFKESAASESFWQLITILDFNCPGPGPDGCGHRGEDPLIIEQSPQLRDSLSHVFVQMEEKG